MGCVMASSENSNMCYIFIRLKLDYSYLITSNPYFPNEMKNYEKISFTKNSILLRFKKRFSPFTRKNL